MENFGQGSGIIRPKELDSQSVDPTLRAQILYHYTAALMDQQASTWNAAERKSVQEQTNSVLRALGR